MSTLGCQHVTGVAARQSPDNQGGLAPRRRGEQAGLSATVGACMCVVAWVCIHTGYRARITDEAAVQALGGRTGKVEGRLESMTARREHEAQASDSTASCRLAGVADMRRPRPDKASYAGKAGSPR